MAAGFFFCVDGGSSRLRGAMLALALAGLSTAYSPALAQDELPLSGPAYRIATEAYAAFERRDYATAIDRAREAIRQRPDVGRLRVLLVRSLAAAGQTEDALAEARRDADDPALTPSAQAELRRIATTLVPPPSPTPPVAEAPPAAADRAYQAADAAYKAYDRRDYDLAVAKAREATSLAPDNAGYAKLLANALAAQELAARQRKLDRAAASSPQSAADRAANAAYEALRRGRYDAALGKAREAARQAPGKLAFRLLLIDALVRDGRRAEALAETEKAVKRFGRNADLLRQRGVLKASLGDSKGAYDDLKAALRLSRAHKDTRFLRLSLADAALATSRPKEAVDILAPLGRTADYAIWVRRGRAWQDLKDYKRAEDAFAEAARAAHKPEERAAVVAARIGLLKIEGRRQEAGALFAAAHESGALRTLSSADLGYLAAQAGDDRTAYEAFMTAGRKGELRGSQLIDAAYAARRAFHNKEAVALFKQAIDAEERGEFSLDAQKLFGLRREVAELTREWGAYTTLSYGSNGLSSASFLPQGTSGRTLQLGSEAYWRPPVIGYRDGRLFELFVRHYMTLSDSLGGATGFSTLQGSAGARWKPFKDYNFVLEASKLYKIGKNSRDDFLLRAAISGGFGGELNVTAPSWWTGQYYAEAARYMRSGENIADGEARFGRSFRMDGVSDRLVLTPFLGVAANFDSDYATSFALGAGPGVNARYWFREDKYTAPRSYVDVTLQYRFHLAGDNRAQGIFAGISTSY